MKVLVKVGGTLLDEERSRTSLAWQIGALAREHRVAVVHGGGRQMTRFLEERGIASRFVGGLRVSDETVIDAACKVIAGSVNKQFVAAFSAAGQPAVGLSGVDGGLTRAEQLREELGFVGRPVASNGALLELLIHGGYLPVIACIAGDEHGTIYNVNADQMAVSCAVAFGADRLLFLTDVAGVKDANGRVLPDLEMAELEGLIQSGVAYGGMQAKLEAAKGAVEKGVSEVVIASGQELDVCARVFAGIPVGTRLRGVVSQTREGAQL